MPALEVLEILEATTGGTRRHLNDLVSHLDRKRFHVSVLCSTKRNKAFVGDVERMRREGIEVKIVPMVRAIWPLADLISFVRILLHIRINKYDIVHTHSSKAGMLGRLAARLAGVPRIIHTPHVFPFQMRVAHWRQAWYSRLERLAAGLTDAFICVSRQEQQVAIEQCLASEKKFVVIENGIDIPGSTDAAEVAHQRSILRAEHSIGPGAPVVATVGRFARQKGHRYLIEAVFRAREQFPALKLVLAGGGRETHAIQSQIHHLGLEDATTILGECENSTVVHRMADIVVLPSLWEGLPYVLIEAMAAGKAIVASGVGGVTDAVTDGENGLLIPPGDVDALAGALVCLLGDPELSERLGMNARATAVERYGIENMINRLEKVYESQAE